MQHRPRATPRIDYYRTTTLATDTTLTHTHTHTPPILHALATAALLALTSAHTDDAVASLPVWKLCFGGYCADNSEDCFLFPLGVLSASVPAPRMSVTF